MAQVKWTQFYGMIVSSTFRAIRDGTFDIQGAKEGLKRLLLDRLDDGSKPWERFVIIGDDGSILEDTTHNPLTSFREFVEANPLRGLGQKIADVERLLSDDPEALAALREEVAGKPGGLNNPGGANQYAEVNANNISIDQEPDLFTQPPAPKPKPKRKRNNEYGTKKDYTLLRLKESAPELFERVTSGELSANAAALEAGIRKPYRSIPIDTPDHAIVALLRVFTIDELLVAIGRIADDPSLAAEDVPA